LAANVFDRIRRLVGHHGCCGPGSGDQLGQHSISVGVLAVLAAVFDPAGITARKSMLPEAAAQAQWTLDRTNGIYEATSTSPTSSARGPVAC
jgi:hypothetical protein